MLLEPVTIPAVALSLMDFRTSLTIAQEKAILKARKYHDGEQLVFLTARLKEFLNADDEDLTFRMNVCRTVVEALAERMVIEGFDAADPKVKAWAMAAWQGARMDATSDDVHEQALRDGESFVIVDWDASAGALRFLSHPRYTGTEVDGDGFGCIMFYPDDDASQKPLYAVKRWIEFTDDAARIPQQRATFYYPERIEKYVFGGGGWTAVTDSADEPWPLPWLGADNKPLGIPVIHFKNKGLRSQAWDAIPLQDAINKTLVDLLGSADLTAFRIFVALGFIPTTDGLPAAADGSNAMTIGPGQMIGNTRTAAETSFSAIDGQDLTPMLNMLQQLVLFLAMVTNIPVGRFQISGQVAAEGTLKQQEEPLMAKVRSREVIFGDAWEDVLAVARRIQNKFGAGGLDESVQIYAQWADAQTRTATENQAEWAAKKAMGIPRRQLWAEMGYSQDKIAEMMADPETQFGSFAAYPGITPTPPAPPPAGA
jgi:hypothetical protein